MIPLILLVFGFVLFMLTGFGIPGPPEPGVAPPRWCLWAFGLACWILAVIIDKAPTVGLH